MYQSKDLRTMTWTIVTYNPMIDEFLAIDVMSSMFFKIWTSDFATDSGWEYVDHWINEY